MAFELELVESFPRVCEREDRPWESDVSVCIQVHLQGKFYCYTNIERLQIWFFILLLLKISNCDYFFKK